MTDEKLIAFMKRVTPITHEPLAQHVAEEWANKFVQEFPEFEKAHTPTDDDREALAEVIEVLDTHGQWPVDRITDAILAAGFRRSEPEPSVETEDEMHTRGATSFDCDRCGQDPEDCYCGDEPQGERFADHSERYVPKRPKEPQGEPSDAQVHAAAVALDPSAWEPGPNYQSQTFSRARDASLDRARAALRAAGEAGR